MPPASSAAETATYRASVSFSDPDAHSWTATVDYGDGSAPTQLALATTSMSLSHFYAETCACTVTVRVVDDHGATGQGTTAVSVTAGTPPAVIINGGVGVDLHLLQATYSASGSFKDADLSADVGVAGFRATVDYGDGSGPQPLALNGTQFSLSHRYSSPLVGAVYRVRVNVADDDGQAGTATQTVTVLL